MSNLLNGLDSSESEAYFLGAVLNDNSLIDEYRNQISTDTFSNRLYGELWKVICGISANSEPVTIAYLATNNPDIVERIGTDRLVNMETAFMGSATVDAYVKKLLEVSMRRKAMQRAEELKRKALDISNVSADELKSFLEQMTLEIEGESTPGGLRDGADEASDWFLSIEDRVKNPSSAIGMVTGWSDLDEITLGWQRKDLVIVGGRTSVGKSAFATENLLRILRQGFKVAVFSLEMSAEQIRNRIGGNVGKANVSLIRTGELNTEELQSVGTAIDPVAKIAIDDSRDVTVDHITAEMRRWKRIRGLDFVVIDYLQEIQEPAQPNDNTGSALGRIARKLRKAAMECDCTVMALSQLNREATKGKPSISQLSGSAGLESAADVIILLDRDKEDSPKILDVNVAKHRNGKTGLVQLYYDPKIQRIMSLAKSKMSS